MHLFRIQFRAADVGFSLALVGLVAGFAALGTLALAYTAFQFTWNLGGAATVEIGSSGPNPFPYLVFAAPLAAALVAPIAWWVLIIWKGRLSALWGAGVGALVGLLAHPVMWAIWFTIVVFAAPSAIWNPFTESPIVNRFSELPAISVEGAVTVFVCSLASILLTGWFTVAVGALGGALIAAAQACLGCRERWRIVLVSPFGA